MTRRRPLAPIDSRQFEIPMPKQPRNGAETRALYRAVQALRANGHVVYRCGLRHHRVDGKLLASPQLFELERGLPPDEYLDLPGDQEDPDG